MSATPMPMTPLPMTPLAPITISGRTADLLKPAVVGHGQPTNAPGMTAGAPRKAGVNVANSFKRPEEVVASVENISEYKAALRPDKTLVLAFLAGAYIALGVLVAVMVGGGAPGVAASDPGLQKWLYAFMFPFGLFIIVIVGGELVTSNFSVMPLGVLAQRVSPWRLLRNWLLVYLGNFAGSLFVAAVLLNCSDLTEPAPWHNFLINGALKKVHLSWTESVLRGIGCNWLVCLAFWSAQAAEDITGKILALWFPVTAFVAIGFEHSVAQMSFIPSAMMIGADISVGKFLGSALIPVTIGNIIGGLLVALPYWYVYWLPNHPINIHKCDLGLEHCCRPQHPEAAAAIEAAIAAKKANAPISPCPTGIKAAATMGACASSTCCAGPSAAASTKGGAAAMPTKPEPPAVSFADTESATTSATPSAVPSAAVSVSVDEEAAAAPSPLPQTAIAHISAPKPEGEF